MAAPRLRLAVAPARRLALAAAERAMRSARAALSRRGAASAAAAPTVTSATAPAPAALAIPGDHMLEGMGLPASSRALTLPGPFALERGDSLRDVRVAFNTYGRLNAAGDNAVLVGHSLTSNSCVHEWWSELVGEGPAFALDTNRFFVVCANFLGSVYGSSGPLDLADARTGRRVAADFPVCTVRDNAHVQRALLQELGVRRVAFAIGGSLGGALALEFAASFPQLVDGLVLVATCARHADWAIGLGEVGRQAIYADPRWRNGYYLNGGVSALDVEDETAAACTGSHGGGHGEDVEEGVGRCAAVDAPAAVVASPPPLDGLSVARQFAMLSYRTPQSLTEKFGRELTAGGRTPAEVLRQGGGRARAGVGAGPGASSSAGSARLGSGASGGARAAPHFEVESYLNYQGLKLTRRFDPLCYVRLTQLLDSHDVGSAAGAGGDYAAVLRGLRQRTLVVGIDSDLLYPLSLSEEMARLIPGARLHVISSPHGHDSFLIHIDELNKAVAAFVR